ncbi:hypothetical protein GCM10023172_06250 [Hymenobacter ginsengisoli]|uniref:DUF4274 domain-containing protein n=1 Tax=Hymenobacter ginsengisoli TaxID=1051626 RepID=A0ABP8PZF9_9BACT|nr:MULTISPECIES: hypothetical protein [unclassified Hymenobacter]MBO2032727.1 hypothetical protein [Hymenobacter sp. BT559]
MPPENTPDQWLLAYTMGNISELAYAASWMDNLEYVLWHALTEGPRRYGRHVINSDDIKALKMLSERCGAWMFFDDTDAETPIPLDLWQEKYAQHIKDNPHALR